MPDFENLSYRKSGAIATLTIDRPKALNALNQATLAEIQRAMQDAASDPSVHGVIVTGAGGKAFVAGADITEIASASPQEAQAFTRHGQAVFDLVETLGKPVIAAVNGYALGGGCELAMACTLRIAAENASFGQPEVKLGVMPGFGGTQRLPRLVGKGPAMQIILTAENIDAREAHRIGLVNEVVEPARLMTRAEEILLRIIANAPLAVRLAMEAVNHGLDAGQAQGLALESVSFALCAGTEDKREGTTAFLERRPPRFSGR
ncbi:MAG: Short chain enoyl-CoA hydratase [Ramlibacter sp.]|nr:Short chain enoyl-CoA hydratase [Ramlibacter sp.]